MLLLHKNKKRENRFLLPRFFVCPGSSTLENLLPQLPQFLLQTVDFLK
jgi:hypothetical protein